MTHHITLELSESLTQRVREIATQQQRSVEELLISLIEQATHETPMELLSDEQVLTLCDQQMGAEEQARLSELLEQQREGTLGHGGEPEELAALMQIYRQGLIQKAKAMKIAVERNLRPSLNSAESDFS
jgi:fructose-1,6-bisphosphatase/sedoheptulose 1,7-bisphosphatase-like protein